MAIFNKSFLTNLVALCITVYGYYISNEHLLMVGYFALSGAITNWLAIYMLFEKVPLLYGSGVIPNRFEEFKSGIRHLIVKEFFNREHIERFFSESDDGQSPFSKIAENIDFDKVFDGLMAEVMKTSLGGVLGMFGGADALKSLKEPIKKKLLEVVKNMASDPETAGLGYDALIEKAEDIVQKRLDELTPNMVKKIIQDMMREHLGWLVVWGGVFGGVIGFFISYS